MTIGPWDREKLLQRATEDRKTDDRGTKERGRQQYYLTSVPGSRYYELRPGPPPKGRIVLDEMSITPSKGYRENTEREVKKVIAGSKAGKTVDDHEIELLQMRLLTGERQSELVGENSEGRRLAEALGEARRTNLVKTALDTLAKAKKGRVAAEGIEPLQQKLLTMEHQDQIAGRQGEGQRLALELGEVRRSHLVAEAKNMLAGSKRGIPVDSGSVEQLQQRLLGMERQDELFGQESEGKQLAVALSDVRRSQLVAEARNVLAEAKRGRQFPDADVRKLQQLLGEMERQDQMVGQLSEGMQLAIDLSQLRH
jgi:hypothetical protein